MSMDLGYSGRPWWEALTKEDARDPLGAIYSVQVDISAMEGTKKELERKLEEHQLRLQFLREVVQARLGLDEKAP